VSTALYTLALNRPHQVYRNAAGKRLPGVTTVLGVLDKPALLKWAWNQGKAGIDFRATRDNAANIGTVAHARIEAWLRNLQLDETGLPEEAMDKSRIGFSRFVEWWGARELRLEACEVQMVSESMQVGGTADIVAVTPDGKRLVIDVKTSSGVYREAKLQVAAYAALWDEREEEREKAGQNERGELNEIDECWIVRVGKDELDATEAVEVTDWREWARAFAAVATAYHALAGVGR